MVNITAIVLTYNEESKIADCLQSIGWADELIVVDSFSTDRTVEIARGLGAKVVQNRFVGFATQRDFALTQGSGRWVLFLDADERCTPELGAEIRAVTASGTDYDGFYLPRRNYVFGKWLKGGGHEDDKQLRLYLRGEHVTYGDKEVHELPQGLKKVGTLQGFLAHYNYETIHQYLDKMNRYTDLEAHVLRKRGLAIGWKNVLWYLVLKPVVFFLFLFVYKRGYVDGLTGLIYGLLSGYYVLVKYAKCWEAGSVGEQSATSITDRSLDGGGDVPGI